MKKINYAQWLKRLLIYGLGMFLIAVGINISIKSNLGVSAVSSLPYVLSLKFTFLSVGNWTIAIYSIFVLIQLALLLKEFKWYYIFQFAVSTIFGFLVDGTAILVDFCLSDVTHYALRLLYVAISVFFIALGILLYLEANVMSMPAEGVNVAMSKRFTWSVSTCKIIFDVFLVATAVILSFAFFGSLQGVREGTVIIAVCVGLVMKPITKLLKKPLHTWLFGKEEALS